jgi:hypothetical protein
MKDAHQWVKDRAPDGLVATGRAAKFPALRENCRFSTIRAPGVLPSIPLIDIVNPLIGKRTRRCDRGTAEGKFRTVLREFPAPPSEFEPWNPQAIRRRSFDAISAIYHIAV